MPEQVKLSVQRREVTGKKVRQLRRQGMLPANIFGGHRDSIAIQVDAHELTRILKAHGHTTLFRLAISPKGGEDTVLIRHVQREPVSGAIQHIDFLHVEMSEPIRARIPIHTTGEAPAIKLHNGILMHPTDTLEVEALPADLPEMLVVDISQLTELNSSLYARDVRVPQRVKLLADADEPIITISAPRAAPVETTEAAATPAPAATPQEPPSA